MGLDVQLACSSKGVYDVLCDVERILFSFGIRGIFGDIQLYIVRLEDDLFKVLAQEHKHIDRSFDMFTHIYHKVDLFFIQMTPGLNDPSRAVMTLSIKFVQRSIIVTKYTNDLNIEKVCKKYVDLVFS